LGVLYKLLTSRELAHGANPSAVYVWYGMVHLARLFYFPRTPPKVMTNWPLKKCGFTHAFMKFGDGVSGALS
jgi:hypothetical protein